MKALYPIRWTVPQAKKCFAPVPHTQTHPDGMFDCVTIDPDYQKSWQTQFALIKPYIHSGNIIGIFLGDEHLYFGVQVSHVKEIADTIRRDWPEAIIYLNEAPDVAM
jgi:hypothetical protein